MILVCYGNMVPYELSNQVHQNSFEKLRRMVKIPLAIFSAIVY